MRTRMPALALLVIASAWASSAAAATSQLKDDANFFTPQTESQARDAMKAIQDKYQLPVIIETLPTIPESKRSSFREDRKNQFYSTWVQEKARESGQDGIYILITREPSFLQVGLTNPTSNFGNDQRDQIRNILISRFKQKQFDAGLNEALGYVSDTFRESGQTYTTSSASESPAAREFPTTATGGTVASRAPTYPTPPVASTRPASEQGASPWGWFKWVLLIGGGFMLWRWYRARRIAAAQTAGTPAGPMGGGQGRGYGQSGPTPGGGGIFSGMLGGLLGGAAGSWAANNWFGKGNSEEPSSPPSAIDPPPAPPSHDYGAGGHFDQGNIGSSGGDFGSSSSSDDQNNSGGGSF